MTKKILILLTYSFSSQFRSTLTIFWVNFGLGRVIISPLRLILGTTTIRFTFLTPENVLKLSNLGQSQKIFLILNVLNQ